MKIYCCHKYGGDPKNKLAVESKIKSLYKNNQKMFSDLKVIFVSPIHAFGYLYDVTTYEDGIDMCLNLLKDCDVLLTFGSSSLSQGCLIERKFCLDNGIPIIDFENWQRIFYDIPK